MAAEPAPAPRPASRSSRTARRSPSSASPASCPRPPPSLRWADTRRCWPSVWRWRACSPPGGALSMAGMRPRCSVFIAASLDGFIARRDGGIDWLSVVETPGEDYGYAKFFGAVDALILGRRTYDTVIGFSDGNPERVPKPSRDDTRRAELAGSPRAEWPYADKRCVVLTHRPPASRHGERFHTGSPAPLLAELHAEGVRRVYVDGGATIQLFLREGLIDDITLSIIPVALGDGVPLFGGGGPGRRLRLQAS